MQPDFAVIRAAILGPSLGLAMMAASLAARE
jgi:hypothetical protein